ncbi:hypothetical protein [Sphingomonas glaciei]|uniref:Uncharacterized protein n=1 Tax=Sphingomonas glaciei TaxID=2938948 RepID=A0ABY5MU71_9SPHN|nr:hypothetical protein [Sphingomonas glaciei]UUR08053.1 hypothetical protein M1K48_14195 [Sphingomonas glaciei]
MTLLLAALLAAQPAPTAPVVTPPAKPAKEKTICKSSEDSASRLGRRVCKKESEWSNGKLDHQEGSRAGSSLRPQD